MNEKLELSKRILKQGYFSRLPIDNILIEPEVMLWRTTLDLALSDLLKGENFFKDDYGSPSENDFMGEQFPSVVSAGSNMGPVLWNDLTEWFSVSSEDFALVCEFARLPVEFVFNKMKMELDK